MLLNNMVRSAMKLTEEDFVVNDALADDLKTCGSEVIPDYRNNEAIFCKDGDPLKKGDNQVQKNLAKILEVIAGNGTDAFYKRAIADQIAGEMQRNGGILIFNSRPGVRHRAIFWLCRE
ncbi:hypothetical protein JMS36_001370 [Salmonella enterica]|nr:hypothetical protein [Salmonella enterica]